MVTNLRNFITCLPSDHIHLIQKWPCAPLASHFTELMSLNLLYILNKEQSYDILPKVLTVVLKKGEGGLLQLLSFSHLVVQWH